MYYITSFSLIIIADPQDCTWIKINKDEEKSQLLEPVNVVYPDPRSGAFLTPGSGIWNIFFPDPRSQTHISESLSSIFWVKSSIILCKLQGCGSGMFILDHSFFHPGLHQRI